MRPEQYTDIKVHYENRVLLATKDLMRASQPDVQKVIDEELKAFQELLQTDETHGRIRALLKR